MNKMPKRKDSARQILIRHKEKVFEMWAAGHSMKDIHRFLLGEGEDIGYHQIREICISFFRFNTKSKGSFLGEDSNRRNISNRQSTTQQPQNTRTEKFTYNPKAPDAKNFWD